MDNEEKIWAAARALLEAVGDDVEAPHTEMIHQPSGFRIRIERGGRSGETKITIATNAWMQARYGR